MGILTTDVTVGTVAVALRTLSADSRILKSTENVIVDNVSAKGNETENMTETDLQDLDEVRCMELNVQ